MQEQNATNTNKSQFVFRLNLIKGAKGWEIPDFAKALKVSGPVAANYLSGRTAMKAEHIQVLSRAVGISGNWLLTGDGHMFEDFAAEPEPHYGNHMIPYFDVDVMATPIEVFNDQTTVPTFKIDLPGFADCDFAINVYGHSMYPTIESGTIVLCKKVTNQTLIVPGEIYFIVTNDYRMVKRLSLSNKKGHLTASSDNHNGHNSPDGKKYGPLEISFTEILHVYLVKGSIKRHQI